MIVLTYLEKFRKDFPNSVKYINDNLTGLRCGRCGGPILTEPDIDGYPYQCLNCDENKFSFEVRENKVKVSNDEAYSMLEYVTEVMELDKRRK